MAINVLGLVDYVQQQGEQGRARGMENAFAKLTPGAMAGDQNAYARQVQLNPAAAVQVQQAGDITAKKVRGAAKYMLEALTRGNPQEIQGRYSAVRPMLMQAGQAQGVVPPEQWTDDMRPKLEETLARTAYLDAAAAGVGVQSTYVDAQGNRVAILRDGSTQILGQNAPQNQIIDTGNGFYGVNKGNLQAAPVMVGGQGAPAPAAPTAPQTQFVGADGAPVQIDPSLPPQVQASIRANEAQWASAPEGAMAQIAPPAGGGNSFATSSVIAPAPGGQLRSAPNPSEAMAIEEFNRKQTRTMSQEEAVAAGYRPGTIVQVDGYGNQQVMQQPQNESSAADRRDALARKAKLPQLQNAVRGLSRIETALQQLEGGLVNTGPLDQYVVKNLPAGQELEAAVGGIQNSFLALTRVPGIGSQSDLEARIASLQYPSLSNPPEVNRRTMENLRAFARDLQDAYQVATSADTGPASQGAAPSDGVDDLLGKYGVR